MNGYKRCQNNRFNRQIRIIEQNNIIGSQKCRAVAEDRGIVGVLERI